MSAEENKALARRFVEEVMNGRQLGLIDELVAEDGVAYVAPVGAVPARVMMRQAYQMWCAAFPDWHTTIDDILADGDKVVLRVTESGTQTGELMGIAPTGKRYTNMAIAINRFANGKVVEVWAAENVFAIFQQLGALPALDQPPA